MKRLGSQLYPHQTVSRGPAELILVLKLDGVLDSFEFLEPSHNIAPTFPRCDRPKPATAAIAGSGMEESVLYSTGVEGRFPRSVLEFDDRDGGAATVVGFGVDALDERMGGEKFREAAAQRARAVAVDHAHLSLAAERCCI